MVVLAASIVSKSGKGTGVLRDDLCAAWCGVAWCVALRKLCVMFAALVSRQFVDMSRVRIEGLLAAFPKLVGSGQQHTYVETENVRYVYQPMEVISHLNIFLACKHTRGHGIKAATVEPSMALDAYVLRTSIGRRCCAGTVSAAGHQQG